MIQFTIPESVRLTPAGAALTLGTLTFYFTGTSALAPVYTDDTLTTELDNPVVADADGVWADIWLDPEAVYRVILADASGVMQYDNPEYLPYATGAFQYLDAQTRAYSAGALVPGASLTFTQGGELAPLYADAEQVSALPNPVFADAGGLFPAIYLTGTAPYAVVGAGGGWGFTETFPPAPPTPPGIKFLGGSNTVVGSTTHNYSGEIPASLDFLPQIGTLLGGSTLNGIFSRPLIFQDDRTSPGGSSSALWFGVFFDELEAFEEAYPLDGLNTDAAFTYTIRDAAGIELYSTTPNGGDISLFTSDGGDAGYLFQIGDFGSLAGGPFYLEVKEAGP